MNKRNRFKAFQPTLDGTSPPKQRKKPSFEEDTLQAHCVKLFRMFWPEHIRRFYAIPNGGNRDAATAAILKRTGVLAGVLDTFLAVPVKPYAGLYIEFKTKEGRLSENQIEFIKAVQDDYKTAVVRSTEQFLREVESYLGTRKIKF